MREQNQLSQAILRTLAYSDLFSYPLTRTELRQRLCLEWDQARTGRADFTSCLESLVSKKRIARKGKYYFLKGRERLCLLRQKRERISREKWKRAKKLASILGKMPSVKLIAVTGGLAVNNAEVTDDIDLLIITARGRLWLTRFLLVTLTEILGVRRRPKATAVADKICLNIFLDEKVLLIPRTKQSLYTAYEVVQARPLVNKAFTHERFLVANSHWIKKYLPYFPMKKAAVPKGPKPESLFKKTLSQAISLLEYGFYHGQLWYMQGRRTREITSRRRAFFHPHDVGRQVLKRWQKRSQQLVASWSKKRYN